MSAEARIGRYEVIAPLAAGGMAEILLGRLTGPSGFERVVVIKRILRHLARSNAFVEMFLDEARIVASIHHHNVVQVHELGRDGDDLFLVMEYLQGETAGALVRRSLARGQPLAPWTGALIVAEACAGLHAAHELQNADGHPLHLVHRDVSPQNLFVTFGGQVKVIDFGIAKARDRITQTETGQLKGKFDYMSPEQCHGVELDRRSDVFALGVVLYELTVSRRLFSRSGAAPTIMAIRTDPVVPPSSVVAGYPSSLERVVMKALERERDARYATADEMRRDLVSALRELVPMSSPEEELARLMRDLFADRMEEKRELVRRVREGLSITSVPGEADSDVEIPGLSRPPGAATEAGTAIDNGGAHRSSGGSWKTLAAAAVAIAVATIAMLALGRRAPAPAVEPVAGGAPVAASASASASAEPANPPSRETVLAIDSLPTRARVLVDGKDEGVTPLELRLPRRAAEILLQLRKPGYATVEQRLSLDVDQHVLVALPTDRALGLPTRAHRRAPSPPASAPPAALSSGFRKF